MLQPEEADGQPRRRRRSRARNNLNSDAPRLGNDSDGRTLDRHGLEIHHAPSGTNSKPPQGSRSLSLRLPRRSPPS
eukprot:2985693-Rhodomonas_salina.3